MLATMVMYGVVAGLLATGICAAGRRRAQWFPGELVVIAIAMLIPWIVLFSLMSFATATKSLGNLGEFLIAGMLAGLIPVPRVIIGRAPRAKAIWIDIAVALGLSTIVAILFYLIPPLPETGQG